MIGDRPTATTAGASMPTTTRTARGTLLDVKVENMTKDDLEAYHAGYEEETDRKQWY